MNGSEYETSKEQQKNEQQKLVIKIIKWKVE